MIRVLAIDCATWWANVALVEQSSPEADPRILVDLGETVPDSHAAYLLQRVDRALDQAGWSRSDPDLFVATRGPGSFTGVRVGLGTIRGLGLATDRPCAGVTTLEALAQAHGPSKEPKVALLPAGRAELYGGMFEGVGSPPRVLEPAWLGTPDRARETGRAVFLLGGDLAPISGVAPGVRQVAGSRSIAAAAATVALAHGGAGPEVPVAPLYLRPPDALIRPRKR